MSDQLSAISFLFAEGHEAPSFYIKATMLTALACLWICDVVFTGKRA